MKKIIIILAVFIGIVIPGYGMNLQVRITPLEIGGRPVIDYYLTDVKTIVHKSGLPEVYMPPSPPKTGIVAANWIADKQIYVIRAYVDAKIELIVNDKPVSVDPRASLLAGSFVAWLGTKNTGKDVLTMVMHQVPPIKYYDIVPKPVLQVGPLAVFGKEASVTVRDAFGKGLITAQVEKPIVTIKDKTELGAGVEIIASNIHLVGLYPVQHWNYQNIKELDTHFRSANTSPYLTKLRGWFGILSPAAVNYVIVNRDGLNKQELKRAVITGLIAADSVYVDNWNTPWEVEELSELETTFGYYTSYHLLKEELLVAQQLLQDKVSLNEQLRDGVYTVGLWNADNEIIYYIDTFSTPKDPIVIVKLQNDVISEDVKNLPALVPVNKE